jgi:ligand-binding sensor domain-containing protein
VLEQGVGLKILRNGKLCTIQGGEFFARDKIYGILSSTENHLLVFTRERGIFEVGQQGQVKPFKTEIDSLLIQSGLYAVIRLSNGNIALGTLNEGLFIIGSKGEYKQHLNRQNGLQGSLVTSLLEDRQKGLWAACSNGISRVEISGALNVTGEDQGLNGQVKQVLQSGKYLYALTDQGAFVAKRSGDRWDRFNQIPNCTKLGFNLTLVNHDKGPRVFACMDDGFYEFVGIESKKILHASMRGFCYDPKNNRIFLGTNVGISEYREQSGEWQRIEAYDEINQDVRNIEIDTKGNIWFSTLLNGVFMI